MNIENTTIEYLEENVCKNCYFYKESTMFSYCTKPTKPDNNSKYLDKCPFNEVFFKIKDVQMCRITAI